MTARCSMTTSRPSTPQFTNMDMTGWVPGYHSIARYHEDIDTVVVQFVSTTGGETWGTADIVGGKATGISNIIYNRIVRILRR
jgi:D-alanyl-D-alanine carboxypeptidase